MKVVIESPETLTKSDEEEVVDICVKKKMYNITDISSKLTSHECTLALAPPLPSHSTAHGPCHAFSNVNNVSFMI